MLIPIQKNINLYQKNISFNFILNIIKKIISKVKSQT